MNLSRLRKFAGVLGLGFAIMAAGALSTNAQTWRYSDKEQKRIYKEQQKIAKRNAKLEQERLRRERQRNDNYGYRDNNNVYGYPGYGNVYDNRNNGRIGSMREATNSGYQQGVLAGQYDRRKGRYNQSNVYRDNVWNGDPTGWDYYYRQGYLQGYQAGYNGGY